MSGFGTSHARGRRAAPRAESPLRAVLVRGADKRSALLRDISRTGARLCGKGLPGEGEEIRFAVGPVQVVGEVVRSENGECAVAFDMPLATAEVKRVHVLANFVGAHSSQ